MESSIKNLRIFGGYEDFKNVYLVFRNKPFYEDWDEEKLREEYDFYNNNGEIYVKEVDGKALGLVAVLQGVQKGHGLELPTNNVGYISDIVVIEECRRRGYGTELMKYALDCFNEIGNEYAYFRASRYGSMSEPIGLKLGFEPVYKENGELLVQECSFPRVNNIVPETDERKFLIKKLK